MSQEEATEEATEEAISTREQLQEALDGINGRLAENIDPHAVASRVTLFFLSMHRSQGHTLPDVQKSIEKVWALLDELLDELPDEEEVACGIWPSPLQYSSLLHDEDCPVHHWDPGIPGGSSDLDKSWVHIAFDAKATQEVRTIYFTCDGSFHAPAKVHAVMPDGVRKSELGRLYTFNDNQVTCPECIDCTGGSDHPRWKD